MDTTHTIQRGPHGSAWLTVRRRVSYTEHVDGGTPTTYPLDRMWTLWMSTFGDGCLHRAERFHGAADAEYSHCESQTLTRSEAAAWAATLHDMIVAE